MSVCLSVSVAWFWLWFILFQAELNRACALVHVFRWQGYDMEDAMIVSQGAVQRGFMHARVLKTELVDVGDIRVNPREEQTHGRPIKLGLCAVFA